MSTLTVTLALFCFPIPGIAGAATTADSTDRAAIVASAEAFSAAYMRGDVDAMMDRYTNDAVILPGGSDMISRRESIRAYWSLPPGRTVTHHRSTPVDITVVGSTAYDYGYYEGSNAVNGEPAGTFRGKYLIVWVKGNDGIWRMRLDMWNTLAPQRR